VYDHELNPHQKELQMKSLGFLAFAAVAALVATGCRTTTESDAQMSGKDKSSCSAKEGQCPFQAAAKKDGCCASEASAKKDDCCADKTEVKAKKSGCCDEGAATVKSGCCKGKEVSAACAECKKACEASGGCDSGKKCDEKSCDEKPKP
jgi:hypothetical protein